MNQKSRKISYYIINAVVILVAVYFLYTRYLAGMIGEVSKQSINLPLIVLTAVLIAVIYFFKALRLYIILIDNRISLKRFFRVYIKSMPVSLAFPLKAGELFRMYCFASETGSLATGILGILAERFFDTIPLLALIIIFTLLSGEKIITLVVLLAGFLVLITALYLSFPSIYTYANRYCIVNIRSGRSLKLLKLLDIAYRWYERVKNLIKDRVAILLIISSFTWLAECGILMLFVKGMGDVFRPEIFLSYISSVFSGSTNRYVDLYVGLSAVLFFAVFIAVYTFSFAGRLIFCAGRKDMDLNRRKE